MKADCLEEQKWRGDTVLMANTNLISWLSYFLLCIRAVFGDIILWFKKSKFRTQERFLSKKGTCVTNTRAEMRSQNSHKYLA